MPFCAFEVLAAPLCGSELLCVPLCPVALCSLELLDELGG
jgi:hypothetical protein